MTRICTVNGCEKISRCWGYCSKHFQRVYKYGNPYTKKRQAKGETSFYCIVKGCNRSHKAKGFCDMHYQRFKKYGDPIFTKTRKRGTGTIVRDGYLRITIGKKRILEHRHVMENHLGRKLLKKEIVHHIDGNPLNNSIDNLVIMTQNEHAKLSDAALNALSNGRRKRWSNR